MAALISYRNLADNAVLTASAMAGFPVENLTTRQLTTRWRVATPDSGLRTLRVDLGRVQKIRIVALLSVAQMATMTGGIRMSVDNVTWTNDALTGNLDLGAPGLPSNLMSAYPDGVSARYIELQLVRAQPEDEFIEAGRLWIGDALVVSEGADSDWTISTRERGSVDESAGLEVYPSAKPRGRELRMSFTGLPESIAFGLPADGSAFVFDEPSFQDLHTHVGAIGEVIALPRSDWIWPRRIGVYGRLSADSLSIRHESGPNYSTSARVIEER